MDFPFNIHKILGLNFNFQDFSWMSHTYDVIYPQFKKSLQNHGPINFLKLAYFLILWACHKSYMDLSQQAFGSRLFKKSTKGQEIDHMIKSGSDQFLRIQSRNFFVFSLRVLLI